MEEYENDVIVLRDVISGNKEKIIKNIEQSVSSIRGLLLLKRTKLNQLRELSNQCSDIRFRNHLCDIIDIELGLENVYNSNLNHILQQLKDLR